MWFRPGVHPRLGGLWFGTVWFATVAVPLLAIGSSLGLLALHFLNPGLASSAFQHFWMLSALVFSFITWFAILIDPNTGKRSLFEGLVYPGLISLYFMLASAIQVVDTSLALIPEPVKYLAYTWSSLNMLFIWLLYRAEKLGLPNWLRNLLVIVIGYGALNGAVGCAAYVAEWKGLDRRWDKTEKTGKGRILE